MQSNLGGSANFLADPENFERPITSEEIRNRAAKNAANDFLAVDEVSLEARAYLVKTTLPSVVVALENLLLEIKTKNIPLNGRKIALKTPDALQKDKPAGVFDAVNWLGQALIRHNDKSLLKDPSTTSNHEKVYINRISEIASELDERIDGIARENERIRLANELATRLAKEQHDNELRAQLGEKRITVTDFLDVSFKLWISSLWRKEPGNLYRSELLARLNEVIEVPEIASNADLVTKIQSLITIISTQNSPLPVSTDFNRIFDEQEPLYHLDCATINRWDNEFYTKIFLRLLIDWSLEEITTFLKVVSSLITMDTVGMNDYFNKTIAVPKFISTKVTSVRDWSIQLAPLIQSLEYDSPFKEVIKKAYQGYCAGREDPKYVFTPRDDLPDVIIENENVFIGQAETAYLRFSKCILGEFGKEAFRLTMENLERELTALFPGSVVKAIQAPTTAIATGIEKMELA